MQCRDCLTVWRERRTSYFLDIAPIRTLINGTRLRDLFGITLLRARGVVESEMKFYDCYDKIAASGPSGTKWAPLIDFRLADFSKHGIDISGKSVLEISGGPGFLAQAMQAAAARVVVTEFSALAADGMARSLQVNAVKFDYNSDDIDRLLEGPFDVVLIINSIGFCNDLRSFVASLKTIMHDQTVVYVCHSPGTLGLMLRWEFDEYTYTRCWEPEALATYFAEIGFAEQVREDEGSYPYDHNWYNRAGTRVGTFLKRLHRLIGWLYRVRALRSSSTINRELVQKNIKQIFRAQGATSTREATAKVKALAPRLPPPPGNPSPYRRRRTAPAA